MSNEMTPDLCRAARALLNWSQTQLAKEAGVGRTTILGYESGDVTPNNATLVVLRQAFNNLGVRFGPGISLTVVDHSKFQNAKKLFHGQEI